MSRTFLLRAFFAFTTVTTVAAMPVTAAPVAGCRNACVTGCNLDQAAKCQEGAIGGATCVPVGCHSYQFECFLITTHELFCGEET